MNPLSLAVVSYFNSRPYVEGLQAEFAADELSILERVPAACAEAFASGEADIALLPVGAMLDLPADLAFQILPDFCIGASGTVDSVFLFSNEPIADLSLIYRDPHSRTSNGLAQVLAANHWHTSPAWSDASPPLEALPPGTGAIVIGDRAMAWRPHFAYVTDLAAEWTHYTGLPFAFAVWVLRRDRVSPEFAARLGRAFTLGLADRPATALRWAAHYGHRPEAAVTYLTEAIDYSLDERKFQALRRYLAELAALWQRQVPLLTLAA
jgi:chorismate dehydratase